MAFPLHENFSSWLLTNVRCQDDLKWKTDLKKKMKVIYNLIIQRQSLLRFQCISSQDFFWMCIYFFFFNVAESLVFWESSGQKCSQEHRLCIRWADSHDLAHHFVICGAQGKSVLRLCFFGISLGMILIRLLLGLLRSKWYKDLRPFEKYLTLAGLL